MSRAAKAAEKKPSRNYFGNRKNRPQKVVDIATRAEIESQLTEDSPPAAKPADSPPVLEPAESLPAITPATTRSYPMTLTLKGLSKNSRTAFYSGAVTTIRISVSAFPNKTAPRTIDVADGAFALPKEKLTPEQRKEARKNAPKPTLAEKIAQREKAIAALKAKAASQPAM